MGDNEDFKHKLHEQTVCTVLERATNMLGCQKPEDAALLMRRFIHQAAHISASLIGAESTAEFLNKLAEHLPNCPEAVGVHWEQAGTESTTKH